MHSSPLRAARFSWPAVIVLTVAMTACSAWRASPSAPTGLPGGIPIPANASVVVGQGGGYDAGATLYGFSSDLAPAATLQEYEAQLTAAGFKRTGNNGPWQLYRHGASLVAVRAGQSGPPTTLLVRVSTVSATAAAAGSSTAGDAGSAGRANGNGGTGSGHASGGATGGATSHSNGNSSPGANRVGNGNPSPGSNGNAKGQASPTPTPIPNGAAVPTAAPNGNATPNHGASSHATPATPVPQPPPPNGQPTTPPGQVGRTPPPGAARTPKP